MIDVGAILLSPAAALSILVGVFHSSAYLVIFGRLGWHTGLTLVGAIAGAFLGNALMGPGTLLRLGDFSLLWSTLGAAVAIAVVELAAWAHGRDARAPGAAGGLRSSGAAGRRGGPGGTQAAD